MRNKELKLKDGTILIEILVPCSCQCHSSNSIMHYMQCCDRDGMTSMYVEKDKLQILRDITWNQDGLS